MAARAAASAEEEQLRNATAAAVVDGGYDPATLEDLKDLLGVRALPTKPEPQGEERLNEVGLWLLVCGYCIVLTPCFFLLLLCS